ncbi:hypothetical protein [Cellulomonas dongxiuzhuiae]|uniref:hypothetical protein n=1 Tax=Cellulomonas dongxiuzhuiae TaxID=2819979 RepID=UPI001AAEDCB8|nr:hypothetical protein [Cellulomonas dongxiuzhuiae]MBO3094189.1 hypothetical protein [Cellulomonas dongxiuzhuiae]
MIEDSSQLAAGACSVKVTLSPVTWKSRAASATLLPTAAGVSAKSGASHGEVGTLDLDVNVEAGIVEVLSPTAAACLTTVKGRIWSSLPHRQLTLTALSTVVTVSVNVPVELFAQLPLLAAGFKPWTLSRYFMPLSVTVSVRIRPATFTVPAVSFRT